MTQLELLKDIEFWTGLTVVSDPSLKAKFINRLNRRYEKAMAMLGAASNKGVDDTNYPTQPFSFFDIVQNQHDYEFLTDEDGNSITDITGVLIIPGTGEFVKIKKLDLSDTDAELIMSPNSSNTGIPTGFIERNNTVFFDKIPNFSKEKGGKLFYKRVPSYFTIDDDSKEPGFNAEHHQILSQGASYDWLLVNKSNAKTLITRMEMELEKSEREFRVYAELRNPQMRRITFRRENTR